MKHFFMKHSFQNYLKIVKKNYPPLKVYAPDCNNLFMVLIEPTQSGPNIWKKATYRYWLL